MSTEVHDLVRVDDKTVLIDGERYIRSWKGTKPSKERSKEEKNEYMRAYRMSKRHELLTLQRNNLELEDQIRELLNKS